ncbi:hypothetical protein [uncultured Vibrio sp.]|uniref:hypothetical protein n=1 Tax=uncultured Vibrio sp. TaxID=114054 RepID=UPI0025E7CDA8|nr:hypothetical protein [uncultured Vibrio sp.]
MTSDLLLGYWIKSRTASHICIGFQYGGHMGGECELYLPVEKYEKFCENFEWRRETVERFYKIVFLATPDLNVPIPREEAVKDGIVPDNW